jgi:hypothetical protein
MNASYDPIYFYFYVRRYTIAILSIPGPCARSCVRLTYSRTLPFIADVRLVTARLAWYALRGLRLTYELKAGLAHAVGYGCLPGTVCGLLRGAFLLQVACHLCHWVGLLTLAEETYSALLTKRCDLEVLELT